MAKHALGNCVRTVMIVIIIIIIILVIIIIIIIILIYDYYNRHKTRCFSSSFERGRLCTRETALSATLLVLASMYGCRFACCEKEGYCRSTTKAKLSS